MVAYTTTEGLQRIVERIIADAHMEINRVRDEARKKAESVIEERRELAKKDARNDVERIMREAEEAAARINKQVISSAKVEGARYIAVEKNRLIENVFMESGRRLKEYKRSREEYVSLLSRMIGKSVKALGGGELEILLCDEDRELATQLDLKAIVEGSGVENKVQIGISVKSIPVTGGVVVRRVDGKASADYTFESLIRLHEKALKLKVARILFKP